MAGQIVSEKIISRNLQTRNSLDPLFAPKSVAVIGATETANAVGRTILWNLLKSPFGGTVYPVNPKRTSVLGVKAYPTVGEVPEKVDLAVIVTPAATVPGLIQQCADKEVPAAIIISAGFKEMGPSGSALEKQIKDIASRVHMRVLGPNCLGFMNPGIGLNATFGAYLANPGRVAFISQSGALGAAILDWSMKERVGFSAFASVGSMIDIGWGDLIDYLGEDPETEAILIYMETVGDARKFLSAAREVALAKQIIVIKAGRTDAAAKAAASHTGSLTGSDDVLDAAFRRAGVLRVNSISDLFYMSEVLSHQPRPKGKRLTIITNAGGPGVLATDALIAGGGELAPISAATMAELNKVLPPSWSRNNPVDVLGDADATRYAKALELTARDEHCDGVMVILTPQDMTDPTNSAEAIRTAAKELGKPVLASWMGGPFVATGEDMLNNAGIPTFPYPDTAARMFNYMWQYDYAIKGLYETPAAIDLESPIDTALADKIIKDTRGKHLDVLSEFDSKRLLAAYGIPVAQALVAVSEEEAVQAAAKIGYPAVLKLYSETITHKTDVGGVMLDLVDEAAVREAFGRIKKNCAERAGLEHFGGVSVQPMIKMKDAYEVIVGSSCDGQFGPVILFGSGGELVEVYKDQALGLPPLNTTLARRLIERTKIHEAFKGVRGRPPVDAAGLEQLLVKFSQMLLAQPWIKEVDMNPVLVGPKGVIALDARIILHDASMEEAMLPKPAIRPYPAEYVQEWRLKDNTPVVIRPIRGEDEPLMAKFHATLSEETVRQRYFLSMKLGTRTAHERLVRVCFADYDREMALVAEYTDAAGGKTILGVGRLSRVRGRSDEAEFAIIVADKWQNRGLGTKFMQLILEIGRKEELRRIIGYVLQDNVEMQRLCESCGFTCQHREGDNVVRMEIEL
jgi:acetyltransferase